MAISTEITAVKFLNIMTGVPLNCDFPLYLEEEVQVYYGTASPQLGVLNTDYTVELNNDDFSDFTVTPLAPLLTKINALIAANPEEEINYTTVRRHIELLTSSTPDGVRYVSFLSKEIDRIWMGLNQLQEAELRAFSLSPAFVGDGSATFDIPPPLANAVLAWSEDGTSLINGPDSSQITAAAANAATATAAATAASASADSANAAAAEFQDALDLIATFPATYETIAAANAGFAAAAAATALKANIASPTFTGVPLSTTPAAGDVSTKIATMANFAQGANGASEVLLGTATASNSSTIQFTGMGATFDQYELRITNALPASNSAIPLMRISEDNGATFKSSVNYTNAGLVESSANSGSGSGSTGNTSINLSLSQATASAAGNGGVSGIVTFFGVASTTAAKNIKASINAYSPGGDLLDIIASHSWSGDTNAINAIEFFFSSGNIASGAFALYGIRKS